MVAVGAASNACGTINPIKDVSRFVTYSLSRVYFILRNHLMCLQFFDIYVVYCLASIISIIRKVSAASGRRGGIERCLFFVDAVHYAPHHVLDVQDIGCDFCVCSPFKFFGPHTGINI